MTPEAFTAWLAAMKAAGLARSDAECARLLGRTPHGILKIKRNGGDRCMALACAALLGGLGAYSGNSHPDVLDD